MARATEKKEYTLEELDKRLSEQKVIKISEEKVIELSEEIIASLSEARKKKIVDELDKIDGYLNLINKAKGRIDTKFNPKRGGPREKGLKRLIAESKVSDEEFLKISKEENNDLARISSRLTAIIDAKKTQAKGKGVVDTETTAEDGPKED